MATRSSKAVISIVLALFVAVAAYWYWSPLLALSRMQAAVKASDPVAFNEYVDYPRLRENLKGEMTGLLTGLPGGGNGSAGLPGLIGQVVMGPLVDQLVRPETIMHVMREGTLQEQGTPPGPESGPAKSERTDWMADREGMNIYIAYVGKEAEPKDQRIGLILERSGFADWRLVGLRMPARTTRQGQALPLD